VAPVFVEGEAPVPWHNGTMASPSLLDNEKQTNGIKAKKLLYIPQRQCGSKQPLLF